MASDRLRRRRAGPITRPSASMTTASASRASSAIMVDDPELRDAIGVKLIDERRHRRSLPRPPCGTDPCDPTLALRPGERQTAHGSTQPAPVPLGLEANTPPATFSIFLAALYPPPIRRLST